MNKSSYQDNLNELYHRFLTKTDRNIFKTLSFKSGEFIIMEGDIIDSFYFVVSGKIKVLRNYENGKTLLIRVYDSFTILGDVEYFLNIVASCSVQTQGEVKLIKIPYAYIDKEYRKDSTFLYNILVHTSSKILLTSDQTSNNLMHSLDTRFSSYLLSLSSKNNNIVYIPSLGDIANNLGSSYRHLTRTIKKLADKGVIMKTKKRIEIVDRKLLLELSKGIVYENQIEYTNKG